MSDLVNLEKIENSFLASCSSLKTVVLLDLDKATEIGDGCMEYCKELKSVTMTGLGPKLTTIKKCFLRDCPHLEDINISNVSNVSEIGKKFLANCQEISGDEGSGGAFIAQLVGVKSIGKGFMEGCDNFNKKLVDRSRLPSGLQSCLDDL